MPFDVDLWQEDNPYSFRFQIDNLEAFVKFCKGYGVKENFLFNPTEFYEGRNTGLMLQTLIHLGSRVSSMFHYGG